MEDLGTPNLTMWDEVVHVNVLRNLAQHCCLPRLHRSDTGTNYRHWTNNTVWLHKPLLPFYATAAVYRLLGGSLWALRLPGVIFAALTVVVIYATGRKFLNDRIGLCGAAAFGLNPFTNSLVHGRTLSGFPDLAFCFLMSIALYLILEWAKSESIATLRWFGLVVGLGYLCKGGLALAAFVVLAEVAVLAGSARALIPIALQSIIPFGLVVLPERLYWLAHYPVEFRYEQHQQLLHLFANIEGHGAPWHTYLTYSLPHILVPPMVPFAYFSIGWYLTPNGHRKEGRVLSVWTLTYILPLSLGVSKIDNFVFPVLPAIALLVPAMVEELLKADWHRTVMALCATFWMVFLSWWARGVTQTAEGTLIWSRLYDNPRTLSLLIAGAILTLGLVILLVTRPGSGRLSFGTVMLAAVALLLLYVDKDVYENRTEATQYDGGLSRSEQSRLRQAGSELRGLVSADDLVIVSLGRGGGPKYLYVMYWSGVDVLDVCKEVPLFERFRERKDIYLISNIPLPAAPLGRLPLGDLYPVKEVPFKTWSDAALKACTSAGDVPATTNPQ